MPDGPESEPASNAAITRRVFNAMIDRDGEALADRVDPDLVHPTLGAGSTRTGRDLWWDRVLEFHVAFLDLAFDVDDLVSENDRVVVRARMSGTFEHPLDGHAPSGRSASAASFRELRPSTSRLSSGGGSRTCSAGDTRSTRCRSGRRRSFACPSDSSIGCSAADGRQISPEPKAIM